MMTIGNFKIYWVNGAWILSYRVIRLIGLDMWNR